MANQNSKRDDNRVPGLLIHDSTGAETRQVRSSATNPNAIQVEAVGTGASSQEIQGTETVDSAATAAKSLKTALLYEATPTAIEDGDSGTLHGDENQNLKTTLATALDEDIDAVTIYNKSYTYTRVTADAVISASAVGLCGFYVEASASAVISLYDNASAASGNAMLALSKAVSANDFIVLEHPIAMTNGVYFDLVSGTGTVSILTRKITSV